jgi:hypothetical protein
VRINDATSNGRADELSGLVKVLIPRGRLGSLVARGTAKTAGLVSSFGIANYRVAIAADAVFIVVH